MSAASAGGDVRTRTRVLAPAEASRSRASISSAAAASVGHWLVAIEREGHADASEHGVCRGLRGERCRVVRPQQQEALDADLLDRQRLVAARGESHRDAIRVRSRDHGGGAHAGELRAQRVPGGRGRRVAVVDRRVRPLRLAVRSVFER